MHTMTPIHVAIRLALGVIAFVAMPASNAAAQSSASGDVAAAADAFSRAQQAELRSQWAEAAELYALADRIAPAPAALRGAASAAHRAGMHATAATLAAELLSRDGTDRESRALAEEILRESEASLGRIHVRCPRACRVLVDGRLATAHANADSIVYVRPGSHRVSASFEEGDPSPAQTVPITAAERVELALEPPAPARPLAPVEAGARRGASPWIFATGMVLTSVAGGLSIWSGTRVVAAHDAYDRSAPDAAERYAHGRDLERRTNVLIGTTGALAVGTAIAAGLTNWHGRSDDDAAASARRGHPIVGADARSVIVGWSLALE